jgi:type VI secretion system secreted protein VgrG
MKVKSGSAVTAVQPTKPVETFAADDAKPAQVAKAKAKQIETKTGKYGSTKAKAFKPSDTKNESKIDEKKDWIEIELVGEDDSPISGEKYQVTLPDGTVASGTLDGDGFARIEGFDSGDCKVSFPELDKAAWEIL